MYALYFEYDPNYQNNLQMFRDALRVARTDVSKDERQKAIQQLEAWARNTDKTLLPEDEYTEKYGGNRGES